MIVLLIAIRDIINTKYLFHKNKCTNVVRDTLFLLKTLLKFTAFLISYIVKLQTNICPLLEKTLENYLPFVNNSDIAS